MQQAFLDSADPGVVSHAVRGVLERRGALVSEHVSSRVRFHGLPGPQEPSWRRAGYVGIYQPYGEPEVQLRLILRARWPYRLLVGTAAVNVLLWILFVLTAPSGTTWVLTGFFGGLALVAAAVTYLGTLRSVQRDEEKLLAEFEEAIRQEAPQVDVETEEERERRLAELSLEGELTQRRLAQARKAEPVERKGPRFSLRPKAKAEEAPEETPEARRARLLARKAELEAQRQQGGKGPS